MNIKQVFAVYLSFFLIFWSHPVMALPQNPTLIQGGATWTQSQQQMLINQTTGKAIINWSDFSIAAGELTQIMQPGANSALLNRVTGGNLSEIYGSLKANGSVYLINPNGIMIGASGIIDVNTFVASTLDVNNDAFMAGGDMIFKGDSTAEIKNLGVINANGGDVFLIGHKIANEGTINAPEGTVGLAAGDEVLLKASGDQRIFVRVKKKKIVEATEDETVEDETVAEVVEEPTGDADIAADDDATQDDAEEVEEPVVSSKEFTETKEEYEYSWEPVSQQYQVGEIKEESSILCGFACRYKTNLYPIVS